MYILRSEDGTLIGEFSDDIARKIMEETNGDVEIKTFQSGLKVSAQVFSKDMTYSIYPTSDSVVAIYIWAGSYMYKEQQ